MINLCYVVFMSYKMFEDALIKEAKKEGLQFISNLYRSRH